MMIYLAGAVISCNTTLDTNDRKYKCIDCKDKGGLFNWLGMDSNDTEPLCDHCQSSCHSGPGHNSNHTSRYSNSVFSRCVCKCGPCDE